MPAHFHASSTRSALKSQLLQVRTALASTVCVASREAHDAKCTLALLRLLKVRPRCCGMMLAGAPFPSGTVFAGQLAEPTNSDTLTHKHDIRNIAIIAHVDHGKTTLVRPQHLPAFCPAFQVRQFCVYDSCAFVVSFVVSLTTFDIA